MVAGVRTGAALHERLSTLFGQTRVLQVVPDSELASAAADLTVGPALLHRVGADSSQAWFRVYRPLPTVGFSRVDSRSPGFAAAVVAATARGFASAVRAPGGRAAAYHRSTVCFDLVLPDRGDHPVGRLAALGAVITAALVDCGVDARLGPVPDEYCPGTYSVNGGGTGKLAGTAGRRVRGALLLGGSIVVSDAEPLRAVIAAVYTALGVPCDPDTVAAATDFGFTGTPASLVDALCGLFAGSVDLRPAVLPDDVLAAAAAAASHPTLP
jgi:octanoyl-[GcvH]:protein N-octanoyltransferase